MQISRHWRLKAARYRLELNRAQPVETAPAASNARPAQPVEAQPTSAVKRVATAAR